MSNLSRSSRDDIAKEIRAKHAPLAKTISRDQWHRYKRNGNLYVSVTTAQGFADKPWMARWVAKEQVIVDRAAAVELARRIVGGDPTAFGDPESETFGKLVGIEFDKIQSSKNAADQKRDDAADLGTQIHAIIEHQIETRAGRECAEPDVSDDAIRLMKPWIEWADKVDLEPVLSEFFVFHDGVRIAGAGDLLAFVSGRLALADWKTARGIYLESHMQSVGYRRCLASMDVVPAGVTVDGLIVRIPKRKGEAPVCEQSFVDADPVYEQQRWDALVMMAECSRIMKRHEKRFKDDGL